ncbi:MAG: 1,4-alpha-glucan branching protein domain-containing protein [Elusimicrobiales bacterium]|nr:1,4-alpha-glucan branching protein domain-containing protein [Elusimicrobiales bacterium]
MENNEKGYLALVLHAHLPFIRHPEYEDFLEEDWFFEAMCETYLPMLDVYERLSQEGTDFRVTMSLTPPLCGMMSDDLLKKRFQNYVHKRLELSQKEVHRTRNTAFAPVAEMYERKFRRIIELFEDYYHGNILEGFKKFQDMGKLEIITCCATHGFLPLENRKEAVNAQIQIAAQDYTRRFGRGPRGIWLAECAYNPGDEIYLKAHGIRYFFLETHGIIYGSPRPRYGVYAPVYCPSGVAAFGRDMESAHQVWSAEMGYPGDHRYREFYRDLGYDLDYDYVKPYLHQDGVRRNIGMKYCRITGKVGLNEKAPYNPHEAREMAASHAGNFMFNRERQVEHLYGFLGRKPILVSMYDAELFGHWWYEGPDFIEFLFKKMHHDQNTVKTITPSEYLGRHPDNQVVQPSMSSWGDKGYNEVWLNESNDWMYRHLHKAVARMVDMANRFPDADGLLRRALNQCAREVVLGMSSDWAFLMTVGTAKTYSTKRFIDHTHRFNGLYEQIMGNRIEEGYLKDIEWKDNIFPEVDYRAFSSEAEQRARNSGT